MSLFDSFVCTLTVLPRYIRVNTLVNTKSAVLDSFVSNGYKLIDMQSISEQAAGEKWIATDDHVEGVIALPPRTNLHAHRLVEGGGVILQDKVSCSLTVCNLMY